MILVRNQVSFEPPDARKFIGGLFNVTEYIKDHARLFRFLVLLLIWSLLFFGGKALINRFLVSGKEEPKIGQVSGGQVGDKKFQLGIFNR